MTARLVGDRIVRNPNVSDVELAEYRDADGDTIVGVADSSGDVLGVVYEEEGPENPAHFFVSGSFFNADKGGADTAAWLLSPAEARLLARVILARTDEIEQGA